MVENRRRLLVHVSKALGQHLVLSIKVAVDCPRGYPRQLADVLDADAFQTILAHGFHGRENNSHFGVVQSNHIPFKHFLLPFSPLIMYYTLDFFH